ncbi:MAG: hypothetical protein KAI83_06155 [Thiomargarita sp.]|nr:hypothetical protein [Thiomargarita sp.]
MSHTLTISDTLYMQLKSATQRRGLNSIEQLLEIWHSFDVKLKQRRETVQKIDVLREQLFATYGEMTDSVELIREDRAR